MLRRFLVQLVEALGEYFDVVVGAVPHRTGEDKDKGGGMEGLEGMAPESWEEGEQGVNELDDNEDGLGLEGRECEGLVAAQDAKAPADGARPHVRPAARVRDQPVWCASDIELLVALFIDTYKI